jgi:hypothetical protein
MVEPPPEDAGPTSGFGVVLCEVKFAVPVVFQTMSPLFADVVFATFHDVLVFAALCVLSNSAPKVLTLLFAR